MTTPGAAPSVNLPVLARPRHVPARNVTPATSRRVPQVKPPRVIPTPPEWAHTPPEPATYLRAGWAKLNDGINDGSDRLLTGAVVVGCWYALTARPWVPEALTVALWLLAVVYGAVAVWLAATGTPPWRWTTRAAGIVTGLLAVIGVLWLAAGAHLLLAVVSLAAAQAFAYRPTGVGAQTWWSHDRLLGALLAADILRKDAEPRLRYLGRPDHDGDTTSVTVVAVTGPKADRLGVTLAAVRPKRDKLEAVMGLRAGQLHITHDDDDEASALTFTVTPPTRKDLVTAVLPDRWDYNQPLPIGKDRLGRQVTRRTWGCHAGFVGMTGSGKTWFGRYEVAFALLDPTVRVFLIDGKGDASDWVPMHPLCERVVVGSGLTAGRQALALLDELNALSESRKDTPDADGIVVVIDEFYRLLLEVRRRDPKLADDLDGALTGLHATARSRRMRFLTFWQAGTKDYISKAMRVNIGQRNIGTTESTAEVRYFLEQVPDHLPKASGQFVHKDDGKPPVLVTVPALDRDAFEAVCVRAAQLRAGAIEAPTDPLTVAVHDLLGLGPMKASTVLDMLPPDVRPASAQALGYALKKMGGVEPTTVGPKSDKAWKLSGNLSAAGARVPGPRASEPDLSVPEASAEEEAMMP